MNVFVPYEALTAYKNAEIWKKFKNLKGFDPTGINAGIINDADSEKRYYDLNGNRLNAPKHGINIIDGRKVIVR